ncbi:MAG: peptidylprolyl isomerase [Thaumarchaeota archaeon]|nr:MAG: peptidylprolyl isomerase [Nitrososphaerota archaeon]
MLETNLGTIVIEFFTQDAPNHVDNFISLTESGFYNETIFHRIIPGFMIQGGDPNTISGDPSTWGTGGPSTSVNEEFNTIKHNRGIVSMARSADPNSAGSQFFIVHKDSNFLDEQYTVFGRIVTEESFQTLDKIISVEIGSSDRPIDPEQVKITKAIIVNHSEVSNLLTLSEPERTQSPITPSTGNQKFESVEHGITISFPEGWLLQQSDGTQENSPDVVAVGPKIGTINPNISLTIVQLDKKTIDDIISEKNEILKQVVESGNLQITLQKKTTINGNQAYVTDALGIFPSNGENINVKFKEIIIFDIEKYFVITYTNSEDDFDSQLSRFDETINSVELSSKKSTLDELTTEEGGGCLIATAAFGSELAPQVQQLRELRDNTILQTESGIAFMSGFNQFYYSFSPVIADLERESPIFKEVVKLTLTPMLSSLSLLNYVDIDSEQEIISYGIGIILMNIGMYFVAPAMIIYKIRK